MHIMIKQFMLEHTQNFSYEFIISSEISLQQEQQQSYRVRIKYFNFNFITYVSEFADAWHK